MQSFELFRAERRDVAFYSYATIILDFGTLLDVNIFKINFSGNISFFVVKTMVSGKIEKD